MKKMVNGKLVELNERESQDFLSRIQLSQEKSNVESKSEPSLQDMVFILWEEYKKNNGGNKK